MESNTKRWIFGLLASTFLVYSLAVYTTGTQGLQGEEHISDASRRGREHFQTYNCIACHQFYGLGGYLGPDLTNVSSQKGAAYIRVMLQNGSDRMPNFGLSEQEIEDLTAFLAFVDKTGVSPVTNFEIRYDGTVSHR